MLNRNMPQSLYADDSTLGTVPPPQLDPAQDTAKDKPEEVVSMTVDQLKRINAKEAKDAKSNAEKAMLEALGVGSLEEAKAALEAKKQKEDAEKTESQKLQDMVTNLTKERDSEKLARLETEKASRLVKRDAELSLLILDARSSKQVMVLLNAEYPSEMASLVAEDGSFDKIEAEKLLTAFRKDNGHLFKDTSNLGSQSNNNGKPPQPNRNAAEIAKKEIEQKFKF